MSNAATNTSLGSAAGGIAGSAFGPVGTMVGSSLGGMVGGMFGSNVSEDALAALKKAQDAIAAIPVPTAQDMKLVLEPLVQQGILTPEAYSTFLQQPSEFTKISLDQAPRNAELAALSQMQDIADQNGNDAEFRAAMNDATNQANTQMQGQSGAILQNAAERGALNSNMTTAAQLANAYAGNANMANSSVNAAAAAEQRALQAIAESAQLGGQISSQDYTQAAQKAQAMDAINRYNSQNSQQQSNMNVQGRNQAQTANLDMANQFAQANTGIRNQQAQYNAQLPAQQFGMQMQKAGAMAGVAEPMANLYQQGFQNQATTQGNLIGGLGQNLSNYYNNQNLVNALGKSAGRSMASPASPLSSLGSSLSGFYNGAKNAINGGLMKTGLYGSVNQPPANTAQYAPPSIQAGQQSSGWYGSHGGVVPGRAAVPGDHPQNDVVNAHLSPGEVVVPRTAAANPLRLAEFVAHLPQGNSSKIHPEDVKTVLQALTDHRAAGMWHGGRAC